MLKRHTEENKKRKQVPTSTPVLLYIPADPDNVVHKDIKENGPISGLCSFNLGYKLCVLRDDVLPWTPTAASI